MPEATVLAENVVSRLLDKRVHCWSFLLETTVGRYLELAESAYRRRGGVRHQREALKTTSARRIRARMIEDIKRGAVLPPVVVGAVAAEEFIQEIESFTSEQLLQRLSSDFQDDLAIIDGMQRTTALRDAVDQAPDTSAFPMRLEIWLSSSTDSLIYRMLVLNTGQVPWNLKQQLQVVYEPLVKNIKTKIRFTRFLLKGDRRWNGGEFNADSLIEGYIAFGLRRTEVDTQENLADEFSRLDMADALTTKKYDNFFFPVIQMMVDFDVAMSRHNPSSGPSDEAEKSPQNREYTRGRNVLDTQPARIGYIVANATTILGRVGMDREEGQSTERLGKLRASCAELIDRMNAMDPTDLERFLALDVLAERLARRPTSAVGRWERSYFEAAFKILLDENYRVPSMETCWRA